MSEFALARALSDGARQANEYHCFCMDCDDGDNDINDVSKFVRLGCRCVLHYHCLVQYVRSRLGDRLTMSLNGISCPYGSECQSFKTLDEVGGDDTKIYYITTADLDTIVDYGMNHAKLQQYLDNHECEALTHEEVSGLREWIEKQVNTPHRKFSDEDYDLFIISTTKACPSCGYRSTHYHGHQCHHISHARPPLRGGCPNCHVNYCYKCLSTEVVNRRDRDSDGNCQCGYWVNFCHPIKSSSDIKSYIAINEGGIPYDTRCGCVICSDCKYGKSCDYCSGDCCVCTGHVNPSPSECIDINDEEKKWKAEGPALNAESSSTSDNSLWDCCRHRNDDALRQLLESGAVTAEEVNRQDREGRTALYLACDTRHTECVRLLLSHDGIDANIANMYGGTPLQISCGYGHIDIVSLLLSHNGIDVNIANRYGGTPLQISCDRGYTDIVRLLLSNDGIDVNVANRYGGSPLLAACDRGHADIVRLLLSHDGIDASIARSNGDTPLYIAYCRDHTDIVRLLLSHVGIDAGDISMRSCCRYGNDDALRRLLESGAVTTEEMNRQDVDGRTALYLACDAGHSQCIRLLLSHDGIDVNIANSDGRSPLSIACHRGHTDIVRLLLSHDGIDIANNSIGYRLLCIACDSGHTDIFRLLLSHDGIDPNIARRDGITPLYTACTRGHTDIVRLLLSHDGTDANAAISDDWTPLHYGYTPLQIACTKRHTDIVRLLLSHDGIDANIANRSGQISLHIACGEGHTEIVSLLLSHSTIDVNIADSDGKTPLWIACDKGHIDIVRLLLSHDGIDANAADRYGEIPLHAAYTKRHTDIVRLLLSHDGIDANKANSNGWTLLYAACYYGRTDIVRLLLSHDGIDANIADRDGWTPLNNACRYGHTGIVRLLLSHDGIDASKANSDRDAPLHIACNSGHTDIVRLLLSHDGIDVNIAATDGYTPLQISRGKGHTDIVSLLLSHDGIDIDKNCYRYVYCANKNCGKCRKIPLELYLSLKIKQMDKWYCHNNPIEEYNTCFAPVEAGCDEDE